METFTIFMQQRRHGKRQDQSAEWRKEEHVLRSSIMKSPFKFSMTQTLFRSMTSKWYKRKNDNMCYSNIHHVSKMCDFLIFLTRGIFNQTVNVCCFFFILKVFLGSIGRCDSEGNWYWLDENDAKHDASTIQWDTDSDPRQPSGGTSQNCLVAIPKNTKHTTRLHDGNCNYQRKFLWQRQQESKHQNLVESKALPLV